MVAIGWWGTWWDGSREWWGTATNSLRSSLFYSRRGRGRTADFNRVKVAEVPDTTAVLDVSCGLSCLAWSARDRFVLLSGGSGGGNARAGGGASIRIGASS